jgi:hypothetical protein
VSLLDNAKLKSTDKDITERQYNDNKDVVLQRKDTVGGGERGSRCKRRIIERKKKTK